MIEWLLLIFCFVCNIIVGIAASKIIEPGEPVFIGYFLIGFAPGFSVILPLFILLVVR